MKFFPRDESKLYGVGLNPLLIFSLAVATAQANSGDNAVANNDVVWTTPSPDSSGSMPLGNGDLGLNVWVEEGGDLLFYLSKTDAWSENGRLLKLGRVRIRLSPNPFMAGAPFEQKLALSTGEITIKAGRGDGAVTLRIWSDANHPTVRVVIDADSPIEVRVDLENWRKQRRRLGKREMFSAYGLHGDDAPPVFVEPDTIAPNAGDRIVWYHRNERSIWRDNLKLQSLGEFASGYRDPLLHRTFGGAIKGTGLVRRDDASLQSAEAAKHFEIDVHPLTAQCDTTKQWLDRLDQQVARIESLDSREMLSAHRRWWDSFWKRSWIHTRGDAEALVVSRGYALQRFITACAGRGGSPIKFNGSIFTVDAEDNVQDKHEGGKFDADYRRWGGAYWWQNTRLAYWPMIHAGDFDMIQPLFHMYLEALPLARDRTRLYYGHAGAFFPETIHFWGTYVNENYGWDREGKTPGLTDNRYIRYYWQSGIELATMMLSYGSVSGDERFLRDKALPLADEIITFYDEHYPRDQRGRIRLEPAQALETYWNVPNPAPPIAGLKHLLTTLLDVPKEDVSQDRRTRWQRLLGELPPLPRHQEDGVTVLSPAEKFARGTNMENPELYALFPYPLFGVGLPELEMARQSFAHRKHKDLSGWGQDPIMAACLGLRRQAKDYVIRNFGTSHEGSRFPAFWGPNYDWVPDQDHGGVAMIALQQMVMQIRGRKILLLPAWPKEWDVSIKLHAPQETVIEGVYENGAFSTLNVSPAARRYDVVILDPS